MRFLVAFFLALVGLFSSHPAEQACRSGTTLGIARCAARDADRTEQQIKVVAARISQRMRATDRSLRVYPSNYFRGSALVRFQRAEEAWLAYREATCQSAGDEAAGGSLSLDLVPLCVADRDARHLADLRALEARLSAH